MHRRVGVPRVAHGDGGVRRSSEVRNLALLFCWRSDKFIAQSQIQRKIRPHLIIVLPVKSPQPLTIRPHAILLLRQHPIYLSDLSLQERRNVVEGNNAAKLAQTILIELDALTLKTKPQRMSAVRPKHRIAPLIIVEPVKTRQPKITTDIVCHSPYGNEAQRFARHKQRRRRQLDSPHASGQLGGAIKSDSKRVKERW